MLSVALRGPPFAPVMPAVELRKRAVRSVVLLAATVAAVGCPGSTVSLPPLDSGKRTVAVVGRVVDFESCFTRAGCEGVAELRVSLFSDSAVASQKTGPDGAFTLHDVPSRGQVHLIAVDASGSSRYLSTLRAPALAVSDRDEYGIELYALQSTGGLYAAVAAEAQVAVETHALYLGQLVEKHAQGMSAFSAGASATAAPAAPVRYVRDNPRFNPGETALFPQDRTATGPFGQFFVLAGQQEGNYTMTADAPAHTFTPASTPLGRGYVTIGLHWSTPEQGAAGSP